MLWGSQILDCATHRYSCPFPDFPTCWFHFLSRIIFNADPECDKKFRILFGRWQEPGGPFIMCEPCGTPGYVAPEVVRIVKEHALCLNRSTTNLRCCFQIVYVIHKQIYSTLKSRTDVKSLFQNKSIMCEMINFLRFAATTRKWTCGLQELYTIFCSAGDKNPAMEPL